MAHPDPDGAPDLTPIGPGITLINPVTGEVGTMVEAPWDNAEGRLVAELTVKPGGRVSGEHRHPTLFERFSGVDGELTMSLDGEVAPLPPGQYVDVSAGSWHAFWNDTEQDVIARFEVIPGERFLHMIETLFGLARDGYTNEKGLPNLLQLSVFGSEFADVIEFRSPPLVVQKVLFSMVGMVARPLGYRGTYPQLSRTTLAPRFGADEDD